MGGDGGVIATKRAFARSVGKNEDNKRDARSVHMDQTTRATTCALSNEVNKTLYPSYISVLHSIYGL